MFYWVVTYKSLLSWRGEIFGASGDETLVRKILLVDKEIFGY